MGFTNSLRRKYDIINESGDQKLDTYFDKGVLPKVEDNLFATLLNEEGLIKIGNTLHKITNDYTFSVADEDNSMLARFKENTASLKSLDQVSVFENIDHLAGKTMTINDVVGGKEVNARFQGDAEHIVKYGDIFRARLGAWSRTYGRCEVYCQKV